VQIAQPDGGWRRHGKTELWEGYEKLVDKQYKKFAIREVKDKKDIYPVFRDLFKAKD
jgi:uncharacterized sporulation protein YeaH/YhbH (DUF444 family)